MAATAESLDRQVEALQATCPILCPAITPNGYDTKDLVDLIQYEGKESVEAFEELLEDAGRNVSACCVCGAGGTVSTSGVSSDDDDGSADSTLCFTLITGLNFNDRNIVLQSAGFACPQCRALRSTCRMVRYAALRVCSGSASHGDGQGQAQEHQQRFLALAAHLASTNRAPDSVQGNPEVLAVWLQELYCRAYALQVVASNLSGWRAVGPDGQPLPLSRGKGIVAAARLLLEQQQKQKRQQKKRGLQLGGGPLDGEHGSGKTVRRQKAADACGEPQAATAASGQAQQRPEVQEQPPAKKQRPAADARPRDGAPNGALQSRKGAAAKPKPSIGAGGSKPSAKAAAKPEGKALSKGSGEAAVGEPLRGPQRRGSAKRTGANGAAPAAGAGNGDAGAAHSARLAGAGKQSGGGGAAGGGKSEEEGRKSLRQAGKEAAGKGAKAVGAPGSAEPKGVRTKKGVAATVGSEGRPGKKAKLAKQ